MENRLDDVLAAVGPRLRALRQGSEMTLSELSAETGISTSTLSRLESGRRRATLELLLPLARAHGVPLDQLVVTTDSPSPRVYVGAARERDGVTIVPLTRRSSGLQAYKQTLPPGHRDRQPDLRVHKGYVWLYVLSGRLHLVLGEHDLVLQPGEAAEFDTRVPHWLGNSGAEAVEFLSLFGAQGKRVRVRARPAKR